MDEELFGDLVQSLKEATAIARGQLAPARRFAVPALDVQAVRQQVGLSQREFAAMLRVSVKTLQNWEQRRRAPAGPAAALLTLAMRAPDMVRDHLQCPLTAGTASALRRAVPV